MNVIATLMEAACSRAIDPPVPVPGTRPNRISKRHGFAGVTLLLAVALAVGLGSFGPAWLRMCFQPIALGSATGISAVLAAFFISVVLHEAGHLVPALLLDFEVLGGSLGPLRATRLHGKWALRLSGANLFAASVSAVPRSNRSWRTRMMMVVAGGPTATLLGAMVFVCLLCSGPFTAWTSTFLTASAQLGFLLFVLGMIPNGSQATIRNDARLFLTFVRNGSDARAIFLYHLITQLRIACMRPRDYPERLIRELAGMQSRPDASVLFAETIVLWATDRGDLDTAAAWDLHALDLSDGCSSTIQNLTLAQSACFDAIFRGDPAAARSKFADVRFELISPPHLMHRTKAAYHLALGHSAEALAEICRSRHAFPSRLPYYEFEHELLSRLHRAAMEAQRKELAKIA